MKTLLFALCSGVLCAQVGLDAPRFGCAVDSGRGVEMRGLRGNLVSRPVIEGEIRAIACDEGIVAVHRGDDVEVNGEVAARVSGLALLALANGRTLILDVQRRTLGELEMPEAVSSFAVDGETARVLNCEGVWSFDLATGALVGFWPVQRAFEFAAVLKDGRVLAVEGSLVKLCTGAGCETLFGLPERVVSLVPLNDRWLWAELQGGARVAVSERGFFLLPGGTE